MGEEILDRAAVEGVDIHAYLAVAFECPYEGTVEESLVLEQVDRLMQHQPARLMIADTIGAANPAAVHSMMHNLSGWDVTFTIPAPWVWPMFTQHFKRVFVSSMPRQGGWGVVPLRPALKAMWPPKTWSCCASRLVTIPGSICPSCLRLSRS